MHSQRLSRSYQATGCWYGYRSTVMALLAIDGATVAADHPYWDGQEPCYTVEGVPYYTPDPDPC